MKRFVAIVLFAGAVLLSTHILAPAAAPPSAPIVLATDLAAIAQAAPIVESVNAQVDRLRERLANPPAYPAPTRDPFRFGGRREPARPTSAEPAPPDPVVAAPAISAPALPHLVAIASNTVEGGLVRTAVLAVGDDLQVLKAGDTIAKLVIRSVGADAVELADPVSGKTFRILLQ